ncbi:MAG: PEP/pyruvate-binding domain-containing protein, partial [Alphaproteobacteria bacterium]
MTKWVYRFGGGTAEGSAGMRPLLGGKGANLAEMCNLGLPVPPGFTITTEVCTVYYDGQRSFPDGLTEQVAAALAWIESTARAGFGSAEAPLLVSVRSGARASMPGMMDTVLNLGLNDRTVVGLAAHSGDARFAYDSYRRFIQMYGDVVLGVEHHLFEDVLERHKDERGAVYDTELDADDLVRLVGQFKALVRDETGRDFPEDVSEQLWGAIRAVFASWMNQRAVTYRKLHDIPVSWG